MIKYIFTMLACGLLMFSSSDLQAVPGEILTFKIFSETKPIAPASNEFIDEINADMNSNLPYGLIVAATLDVIDVEKGLSLGTGYDMFDPTTGQAYGYYDLDRGGILISGFYGLDIILAPLPFPVTLPSGLEVNAQALTTQTVVGTSRGFSMYSGGKVRSSGAVYSNATQTMLGVDSLWVIKFEQ